MEPTPVPLNAPPLAELRADRTSLKWQRFPEDVLPMFVAEMDFELAPEIRAALHRAIDNSDLGYLDGPGPLGEVFARFAAAEWGWAIDPRRIHLATDVTVGLVETLRLIVPPQGGRVALTSPIYPPFFELVDEVHATVVDVPLDEASGWALDLAGLEQAFASGVDALLLCHPQNPTGRSHSRASLEALAVLAARFGVTVLSDEVHAPLAHPGSRFEPFAPIAAAAGARSVTVTSASKGWNLAGAKCALVIAGDDETATLLGRLPSEVAARTSILGLHASIAAFEAVAWRDAVVERIVANLALLEAELARHAPDVRIVRPDAGYLVWLDFRGTALGENPAALLRARGRLALNSGYRFGPGGRGFARINLACDPSTVSEGVRRIARTIALVEGGAAGASTVQ